MHLDYQINWLLGFKIASKICEIGQMFKASAHEIQVVNSAGILKF